VSADVVARPRLAWRSVAVPRPGAGVWTTLVVAAILSAVCFAAQGGSSLGSTTKTELALLLGAGVAGAATLLAAPARGAWWGAGTLSAFVALGAWTVLSITWAVQPADAWLEVSRTLTYVAVFAVGICAVRVAPERWPSVLAGVALAGVVVCGYALLTKVFPGALNPDEPYARLRAPFGYWNATGLAAALAVPSLVWLGARRHGHAALNALAFPGLGIVFVALMLAYSRGALLAVVIGMAFWFVTVPLRLRGGAVLASSALIAAPVILWAFGRGPLTTDRLTAAVRAPAGHQLGILLVAMVLVLGAVGLLIGFVTAARPLGEAQRRRTGIAVLCAVALVPVGIGIGLMTTHRGLFGSVSHGWHALTDPHASSPPNDPSRLTAVGSVRARYWNEALKAWKDHPVVGVGAGGYATVRPFYRQDTLQVRHAHGYVVQTMADLGIVGLLISLALAVAWLMTAAGTVGLRRGDRGRPYPPERIGLLTLVTTVIVFAVHSFVDWTWFIPGNALPALLCAGWVAGRGPLGRLGAQHAPLRLSARDWLADRQALAGAGAVLAIAVVVAWATWQPLRSLNASNDALAAIEKGNVSAAQSDAIRAHDLDPVALDPLSVLAVAQSRAGRDADALATLKREVVRQPANPEVWVRLADFQLNRLHHSHDALRSLQAALYLDSHNPDVIGAYLVVYRQVHHIKAVTPLLTVPTGGG